MAIAAKKIEIAKDGDATVGCVTDIVVDTEEGIVAEKKTFAVSVPDGKGGTTVVYGQTIQATKIVSVVVKDYILLHITIYFFIFSLTGLVVKVKASQTLLNKCFCHYTYSKNSKSCYYRWTNNYK